MTIRFSHALFILALFTAYRTTVCTLQARGQNNINTTFSVGINTTAYDQASGALYVGLKSGGSTYTISKINRYNGTGYPTFIPFVDSGTNPDGTTRPTIQNQEINLMTLATSHGNANPKLAVVTQNDPKKVSVLSLPCNNNLDRQIIKQTADNLKDAVGNDVNALINIAANTDFVFAAVTPNGGNWGDTHSGIALIKMLPTENPCESESFELKQTGTQMEEMTPAAFTLDNIDFGTISQSADNLNKVALHWDDQLQRLYIGLRHNPSANNCAVVIGRLTCPNDIDSLVLESVCPTTAADSIVSGANDDITIKHLRTMHTSTGASYLIVNGNNGTVETVGNKIFALPLVDKKDAQDVDQGKLANVAQNPLVDNAFTEPAGTLFTNTDSRAQVGCGDLPLDPAKSISDINVVGDTVYVSINTTQDATNEAGIFYSQAHFDRFGRIIGWTPWVKRAFPFPGFGTSAPKTGRVDSFAVDADNGKIWAIEGCQKKIVRTTTWGFGTQKEAPATGECGDDPDEQPTILETSLIKQLNTSMGDGAFAVLDLHQATRGFFNGTFPYDDPAPTPHRYALFGGDNTVTFARTSEARTAVPLLNNPQRVTTDYHDPQNFITTSLPDDAGCVHVLEYSRLTSQEGTANYFFAGTDKGLFVFSVDGAGFTNTTLTTLDMPPFSTGSWTQAPNIDGAIIDIKASKTAGVLYILTFETSPEQPLKNSIYRVDMDTTVDLTFAPADIHLIAQTAVAPEINKILGIQVVEEVNDLTGQPLNTERLFIATNNGIYRSAADIQTATNFMEADWELVENSENMMYLGIAGMPAKFPTTIWPFSLKQKRNCPTFGRGSIHQLNHSVPGQEPQECLSNFIPTNFNAASSRDPFETLNIVRNFWSDGARRFLIINREHEPSTTNKLMSLPYHVGQWNICSPEPQIVTDPNVQNVPLFYWVEHIGATGLLLAGTNKGVIGLE